MQVMQSSNQPIELQNSICARKAWFDTKSILNSQR